MAKSAPKPCTACAARALTNPSGKAKCNGKSPCTWCKNRKISCSYEESEHSTPPSTVPTKTSESTTSHRETTMTLTDKLDGSRTVRFSPDPENLGEVDATDASDFCLPGEPPIESYLILVGERKRKHANSLTRHDFETAPLSTAKRIRGGIEGDLGGDDNAPGPGQEAPNPLPVQPIDPMAQALQAIAMANTTMAASNATTHQMLAQMMERMGDNSSRRDGASTKQFQSEASRTRHRPDLFDEDHTLPMYNPVYSKAVLQIFRDGYKRPFNLLLLTDKQVLSPEASKAIAEKLIISSGGTISTRAEELSALVDGKAETEMLVPQYMQAMPRFVELMGEHKGPELAHAWQGHFILVINRPFRDEIWHYIIRYDIEIRRIATFQGFRPQNWHQNVYDGIKQRYDQEMLNSRLRLLDSAIANAQTAPQHSILSNANGQKSNPAGSNRTGQSSFRNDSKFTSKTESDESKPKQQRCFHCGREAHVAGVCKYTTFLNGERTVLNRAPDGKHWAAQEAPAQTSMYARFADRQTTALLSAGPSLPNPQTEARKVAPNLIPNAWESMLRRVGLLDRFGDIPTGLREGFCIGAAGPVTHTIVHKNHKSALERPDVINKHIEDELHAGRYSGPYTRIELEKLIGLFKTAPLGAVDKPSAPGKFRIVQDFSFPRTTPSTSLNLQIDSTNFPCEWGFFHDVVKAIHDLPPGSMAATCDVDAAFRQIPVHPDDRPHTIVYWDGKFYIDAFLPFGVASANGIFGRPGDAMALIYSRLGFGRVLKWVDDFLFIHARAVADSNNGPVLFSLEAIYEIAITLGWPWKLSKSVPFSNIFIYLGFEWDIAKRWVSLPLAKRKKYLARLRAWIEGPTASLNETEKTVGSLIHCTLAIPDGRPHVAALISFEASFPRAFKHRFLRKPIPDTARLNAEWWIARLSSDACGSSIAKPPPTNDIRVTSDASTSFGIGVIINDHWWSWRLLGGWKSENRDIGWAEAVALELAVDGVISLGIRNASITCHCDNQGVVYAWAVRRSTNPQQNAVFIRIMEKATAAHLHVNVSYIKSADNPADEPSRGIAPPRFSPSPIHIPIDSVYAPFLAPASLS